MYAGHGSDVTDKRSWALLGKSKCGLAASSFCHQHPRSKARLQRRQGELGPANWLKLGRGRTQSRKCPFPSHLSSPGIVDSGQRLFHDISVDVGQPEVSPLKLVSQLRVINPEAVQNRRIEIENRNRITRNVVAEIVSLADGQPTFDAAACQPDRETPRMMIAPIIVRRQLALRIDRASEFTAPYHQRVVEQTTLF